MRFAKKHAYVPRHVPQSGILTASCGCAVRFGASIIQRLRIKEVGDDGGKMEDDKIEKQLVLHLKDKDYVASLLVLRKAVAPVLANNLLPHFTDHSIAHCDRLIEIINKLISPLLESKKLSPQELLILFASCYLHDIGIQLENVGNTQVIRNLDLGQKWEELSENTRRDYLRAYHHLISAEIVMMLGTGSSSSIRYPLPSGIKPDYIAALCEAHCVPVNSPRYEELMNSVPDIRISLLSALLRCADILDESCRRINIETFDTLLLDTDSQKHWWRHYYTEDISFDAQKMEIALHFDFPKEKREEYKVIIPYLQLPWIQTEFSSHNLIFNESQLNWSITWKLINKSYASTKTMPDTVLVEMLKELHFRKSKEAQEKQLIALNSFEEAQPFIKRRLNELKLKQEKTKDNKSYLIGLFELACDMKELGSIRSSLNIVRFEFERHLQLLSIEERLKIGIWIAETMLEDNQFREALFVVTKITSLDSELKDAALITFLKTKFKVMSSNFQGTEVKKTFKSLYSLVSDPVEKQTIMAGMVEWSFLSGGFNDLNSLLSDKRENLC